MKNLTINIEEELTLLAKYRITPNELMFIKTLLLLQDEENEDLFKSYIETLHDCGIQLRDILLSLQEKGIILSTFQVPNQGTSFDPYSIPINKNFIKNIYKCSFELGKELFEVYPQTTVINGNLVMLRTVSRHFDSLEECYRRYGKAIGWNADKHNKIIELVKFAKENNILQCSLSSFVINHTWLDLESIRDGDKFNYNFDSVKVI